MKRFSLVTVATLIAMGAPSIVFAQAAPTGGDARFVSIDVQPMALFLDQALTVGWAVENPFEQQLPETPYVIVLSESLLVTHPDLPGGSRIIHEGVLPPLDPGATNGRTDAVALPADLAPGEWYVAIYVDPWEVVEEANEHDNIFVRDRPIRVFAPLRVVGASTSAAQVGVEYCATLTAEGGDGEYTWTHGDAPPGLTFEEVGGALSLCGTPALPGTFAFELGIASAGRSVMWMWALVIEPPAAPSLACTSSLSVPTGTPLQLDFLVAGGLPPYALGSVALQWLDNPQNPGETIAFGIPDGLSLDADGTMHGAPAVAGNYVWTVGVSDSLGRTDTCDIALLVTESATGGSGGTGGGDATGGSGGTGGSGEPPRPPPPVPGDGGGCSASAAVPGLLGLALTLAGLRRRR